jgi:hypothetical protein
MLGGVVAVRRDGLIANDAGRAVCGGGIDPMRAENYAALDQEMNALQGAYEEGVISDENLLHAFRAFYDTDPQLESNYQAWLAAYPKSYAAHFAHATYYRILAAEARGKKYANETPSAQLRAMDRLLEKATDENNVSMSLTSKPILTYYGILWAAKHYDDRKFERKVLSEGNRIDPRNFIVRYEYVFKSQTRWAYSLNSLSLSLNLCHCRGQ